MTRGAEGAAGGDVGSAADAAAETDTPAGDTSTAGKAGENARSCALGGRVGVELRVGLSTLLGSDRHPGEIPGWGTVTAETARALAAAQHRAEWRYAITDPQGRLILGGITRRRPSAPEGNGRDGGPGVGLPATERAPIHGGIVELHIPAALLTELAAHPGTCGRWAAVIDDIATQYRTSATDALDGAGGAGKQDPSARFAGAVLRRHVQIRDRTCVYPGCRCSARHADLDHTPDHGCGGVTTEANFGPLCRHDHRLKHEGGWRLRQPAPGHFVWTSSLGRVYHTRPQPITTDLPDPLPGPEYPDAPPPATHDAHGPIFYRPTPPPDPPPVSTPTPAGDPDEPPPF
ncbi:MAG: HNH endonuclease signature motif containing protein [Pseudonocardiaceae bacterium]